MSSSISNTADTLMPYIIGGIGGVITLFASGFLKEFFDERDRKAKHKRNVARHVLQICIEASTNSFIVKPREMEDIYSALTDLEGINKEMALNMDQFVSSWQFISRIQKLDSLRGDKKLFKEHFDRVEEKRKILVDWANKIRVGESLLYHIKKFRLL
jgi:hypothetical protein